MSSRANDYYSGRRRSRSRSRSRDRPFKDDHDRGDRSRDRGGDLDGRRVREYDVEGQKRYKYREDDRSRPRTRSPVQRRSRSPSRSRDMGEEKRRPRSRSRERRRRSRSRSASLSSRSSSSSSDHKRHKRKKDKQKRKRSRSRDREKKERKKEKKREKKKKLGAVSHQWGKYGLINETDLYNKEQEFRSWLVEERKINPETINKEQTKKEFARFVEDFNTATLPHEKFYDMSSYERRMDALRSGAFVPPQDDGYNPDADLRALQSTHKRKATEQDTFMSREQLMELRRVQAERIEAGKMKLLGMDVKQNMGVRMDGSVFE
ncbi:unnamed protein product [Somion occarium]|uniref:Uncharacterized protein n=1 Tax=Somion occarium TaxID=3059160 RepID=A0ABP1DX80_9APHY